MAANIISVAHVDLSFGLQTGVFDLSFQVPKGTIFGLIGPSGCGKTTTVRLLTGLHAPDSGDIDVLGQRPAHFTADTRERIGYMPQRFVLYPNLTVWENLMFVASLYGMGYLRRRKRLKEVLELVELAEVRKRLTHHLSGGMQRRLELACALVHNPTLVFADEPTAGVDPILRSKFWHYFRTLRNIGHTLFITTQYIGEATYCDLVGIMRDGRLLYLDTPEGLRRKALGGEVVRIVVDEEHMLEASSLLKRHAQVRMVRGSIEEPGLLYAHVNDASTAIAPLVNLLSDHANIRLLQIEEYHPPFDDIFIMLLQRARQTHE
jgi:ABC-2 type transport system ATP-binding protein